MKKKDKPDNKRYDSETDLKKAKYLQSKRIVPLKSIAIKHVKQTDECNPLLFVGRDLCLTIDVDEEGSKDYYVYEWSSENPWVEFRNANLVQREYSNCPVATGETVCFKTNKVPINEETNTGTINISVIAIPRSDAIGELSEEEFASLTEVPSGNQTFTLNAPTIPVLQDDFDEKMENLTDTLHDRMESINDTLKNNVSVSLRRGAIVETDDLALWVVIRSSTNALSFDNYRDFMDEVLCGVDQNGIQIPRSQRNQGIYDALNVRRALPFNDTDAYRLLKVATEAFLMVNGGIPLAGTAFTSGDAADFAVRMGGSGTAPENISNFLGQYLRRINGDQNSVLPYLAIIRDKLKNEGIKSEIFRNEDPDPSLARLAIGERCYGIVRKKLTQPFLLELIWNYWQEEGMLVQTMNAITRRFQNVRAPSGIRDPLANFEVDTLRPLSNLLWGYVQDEQHRLSIVRRAYEYDHHYGISLRGKAVPKLRTADSRSKFIEGFHNLLHLCSIFFKQDDDTTVIADAFPLLNALKDVHLTLSQGAHNQFGDLPSTARQEMLIQQWILARPEFREFIPTRIAVAYPEAWMDRVEAMKSLQGWTDTSTIHFHNLAVFGEQVLLGVRYGAWSMVNQSNQAGNWARFWRSEIQGYIHAYRVVTGVDLSSFTTERIDSTPPSVHIMNRFMEQARRQQ